MKVGIFCKEGGQLKVGGLDASGGRPRQAALSGPGACLCSIQHVLAATMHRQFTREFDISSPNKPSKKAPSMGSGKRGGRPGHLPQVTPWKKGPQEKSLGGAVSKVILGRKPQACLSGGPLALDSFPPISGLPVLGRTGKYSLVSSGARQPKQNTGKPPGASRTKDSDLCNRGKEPAPKSQVSRRPSLPLPSSPLLSPPFPLQALHPEACKGSFSL